MLVLEQLTEAHEVLVTDIGGDAKLVLQLLDRVALRSSSRSCTS
jgi:hypothetical protein